MITKAFTLIELLVVVAIIGVLASIAIPNFQNSLVKARMAKAVADMNALNTAIECYCVDNNQYPQWTEPDGTHKIRSTAGFIH